MIFNSHKKPNNYKVVCRAVPAFIGVFIAIYAIYFASMASDGITLIGFGIVIASSSSFVALSLTFQKVRK